MRLRTSALTVKFNIDYSWFKTIFIWDRPMFNLIVWQALKTFIDNMTCKSDIIEILLKPNRFVDVNSMHQIWKAKLKPLILSKKNSKTYSNQKLVE